MDVTEFKLLLPKIEKNDLGGIEIHKQMASLIHNYSFPNKIDTYRKASVMALLYVKLEKVFVAMIERTTYDGKHSGQIAFAGGKKEPEDESNWACAQREVFEEIGVNPIKYKLVKALSPVCVAVSNFIVYPFVAFTEKPLTFTKQEKEVENILEIELASLLEPKIVEETSIKMSENESFNVPCFNVENTVIWGATAMIVNELIHLINHSMEQ